MEDTTYFCLQGPILGFFVVIVTQSLRRDVVFVDLVNEFFFFSKGSWVSKSKSPKPLSKSLNGLCLYVTKFKFWI